MKKVIIAIFISFLFAGVYAEQGSEEGGEPIAIGFSRTIYSKILRENREVYISLPRSYKASEGKRYPLYLTMDARAMFYPAASMIRSLSSAGVVPEMIVVSIKNTDRWRDLTPAPIDSFVASGGGNNFLEFVSKELLPFVDKNWRTNSFRVLSGHSLGGLIAFHSFASGSNDFDAFVALSPTLSWGGELYNVWMSELEKPKGSSGKLLYMAMADEKEDRTYFDEMDIFLTAREVKGFEFYADRFNKTDNHHSVRVPGELFGMRWVFKDYHLSPKQVYEMSDGQIRGHYKRASKKYKQQLEFDVMQMTNAAYWGLDEEKYRAKAMSLFHLAVKRWTKDPYAWSCLAEGYEKTGEFDKAHAAIIKSVVLAKENGFFDMQYLESILHRVKGKLKSSNK